MDRKFSGHFNSGGKNPLAGRLYLFSAKPLVHLCLYLRKNKNILDFREKIVIIL